MILVDASVAFKWIVPEEGTEAALALFDARQPLVAPDVILVEVANAAWKAQRLGRLAREQLVAIAAELPGYFDELIPGHLMLRRAVEIAAELDHPVYDCVYLALAESFGTLLVTADRRFANKVAGSRWEPVLRQPLIQ